MTTLTKAKFLELTTQRVEEFKNVAHFGDVWLRDVSEVQRSRRMTSMYDNNGNRLSEQIARRKLFDIIDQVCIDSKGTPMFTDADLPQLQNCSAGRLNPLLAAIAIFNGDTEKNDEAGSND